MNLEWGGSYIGSPDWIKNKNATVNYFSDHVKCFQHAATVTLNYEEIGKNLKRKLKIKSSIN